MRLSSFITSNLEPILREWIAFARSQRQISADLDEDELLDHGKEILQEIAADMLRPQSLQQQQAKSQGRAKAPETVASAPSRRHAHQRGLQGLEVDQLVAEYRSLRATVLRLWTAASDGAGKEDLEDMTRFNEAVDQAITESLATFVADVNRQRDLFLGMLGHDLRGPLSTIASCATFEMRTRPDPTRKDAIVLRSVAQMKALLDDLVEYTRRRLGAGLAIEPAPLHLEQLARNALDEIGTINSDRTLELSVQGDQNGHWDARRLHQALSNLVFNALKYGAPDSPVEVRLDGTQAAQVVMTVQNVGRPIHAELLPRLFEPLVRTSESDPSDSPVAGANLGLGLYVVREIARAHGGTVSVTSDAAATRFSLLLPRHCVRQDAPDTSGTLPS